LAVSSNRDEELRNFSRHQLIELLQTEARAQNLSSLFFNEAVADQLGLNSTDHNCLCILRETGPVTAGQLARETSLTTGAVTGVIDRLEAAGLVKREHDTEDRRRIIIRPQMEKVECDVEPVFGCLRDAFAELCSEYSDEEIRLLIDFVRRTQTILRALTKRLRSEEAVAG
jgi:DNA-binding MarR family transcriptional regulator